MKQGKQRALWRRNCFSLQSETFLILPKYRDSANLYFDMKFRCNSWRHIIRLCSKKEKIPQSCNPIGFSFEGFCRSLVFNDDLKKKICCKNEILRYLLQKISVVTAANFAYLMNRNKSYAHPLCASLHFLPVRGKSVTWNRWNAHFSNVRENANTHTAVNLIFFRPTFDTAPLNSVPG